MSSIQELIITSEWIKIINKILFILFSFYLFLTIENTKNSGVGEGWCGNRARIPLHLYDEVFSRGLGFDHKPLSTVHDEQRICSSIQGPGF